MLQQVASAGPKTVGAANDGSSAKQTLPLPDISKALVRTAQSRRSVPQASRRPGKTRCRGSRFGHRDRPTGFKGANHDNHPGASCTVSGPVHRRTATGAQGLIRESTTNASSRISLETQRRRPPKNASARRFSDLPDCRSLRQQPSIGAMNQTSNGFIPWTCKLFKRELPASGEFFRRLGSLPGAAPKEPAIGRGPIQNGRAV